MKGLIYEADDGFGNLIEIPWELEFWTAEQIDADWKRRTEKAMAWFLIVRDWRISRGEKPAAFTPPVCLPTNWSVKGGVLGYVRDYWNA